MRNFVLTAAVLLLASPGRAGAKPAELKASLDNLSIALGAERSSLAALSRALTPQVAALPDLGPALEGGRRPLENKIIPELESIEADLKSASAGLGGAGGYCNGDQKTMARQDQTRNALLRTVVRTARWATALEVYGQGAGQRIEEASRWIGPNKQGEAARAKALADKLRVKTKQISKRLAQETKQQNFSSLHRLISFCRAIQPKPLPPPDPRRR